MNRYDYAYYALSGVIGAIIGSLASQAVLYGEANSASRSARTKTRR